MKKSYMLLLFLLFLMSQTSEAKKRTIKNPQVVYQSHYKTFTIQKVEMADTATIVYAHFNKPGWPGVHSLGQAAYLEDELGNRYNIKSADGFSTNLAGEYVSKQSGVSRVIFEPMPLTTEVFDLHVNFWLSPMHIYGIHDKKHDLDVPGIGNAAPSAEMEELMRRKGKVVVKGQCEGNFGNIFPVIQVNPYRQMFPDYGNSYMKDGFSLFKREDGTFERTIELDCPVMAYMKLEYNKRIDGSADYRASSDELIWLVPCDTTEVVIDNNIVGFSNVHYPRQEGVKKFLNNAPIQSVNEMKIISNQVREGKLTSVQLDSITAALNILRDYLAWKYKMNGDERFLLSEYTKMLVGICRGKSAESHHTASDKARNAEGLEGYEVLKRISGHLLGKYVLINFFNKPKDVREVENLLEDFKDSKDIAFVFVSCDSLITDKREYEISKRFNLRDCKDCFTLTSEQYNRMQYIITDCTGYPNTGMTLNRRGEVMDSHQPLGNEYHVRRSIKQLLKDEQYLAE